MELILSNSFLLGLILYNWYERWKLKRKVQDLEKKCNSIHFMYKHTSATLSQTNYNHACNRARIKQLEDKLK